MVIPSSWLGSQAPPVPPAPPGPHPGMHPSTSRYLVATGAYPPHHPHHGHHHHGANNPPGPSMYTHSPPPPGMGRPRPPSSASTASTASFHTAQTQQQHQQQQPTDVASLSSRGTTSTPTGSVATLPSVSTEKTGSSPPPGNQQPPPSGPPGPPSQQQQQHQRTMPHSSHLPPPPPHGYPIPPRASNGIAGGPVRPVARGYYGGRPRHPNIMLRVQNPMAAMIEEQAFARGKYAPPSEGYYSHHGAMQRGGGQHHMAHHPHHISSMGSTGHPYQHHHHRGGGRPHHGRTFPPVHAGSQHPPQATSPYLLPRPSPETVNSIQSMGSAPSPPPVPPSQHEDGKVVFPTISAASSKTLPPVVPLQDRLAATAAGDNSNFNPLPKKGPANHSDAASILLQLGCGSVEKNGADDDATIATSATDLAPALSIDESNAQDCAPDLTSEPSSDSADNTNSNKEQATTTTTSSFPTLVASEFPCPVPVTYPTRLSLPFDENKLNSNHCYLRSELLEIFVVQKSQLKSPTHSPGSSVGRVGLRCVHCANIGRERGVDRSEAPMAVFYPKSISEIYRLVTSWQRCHLRKCKNVPPSIRKEWNSLRESDKSRGKVHYWMTSAMQIGLMDCNSRAGGIRFSPQMCEEAKLKQQKEQEQQ